MGVRIIDITKPVSPVEIAHYDTPGYSEKVTHSDGFIYVADNWGGLLVLNQGEFRISGQINHTNGIASANNDLVSNLGLTTTTDQEGLYAFENMIAGFHTITPTHPLHTFIPPSRNIVLPPDASGQNFILIAKPISKTIPPGTSTTLTYTDTLGLPTSLRFGADSVQVTTTLYLTPTYLTAPTGFAFSGHAINISPDITFSSPVTLTINYSQNDIRLFRDPDTLELWWQTNGGWEDANLSCTSVNDRAERFLTISEGALSTSICQTGLFTFFGPTNQLFFPFTQHK